MAAAFSLDPTPETDVAAQRLGKLRDVVYVGPLERYAIRERRVGHAGTPPRFDFSSLRRENGAQSFLLGEGIAVPDDRKPLFKQGLCRIAAGIVLDPGQPAEFVENGKLYLNRYVPPLVLPAEGLWPTLHDVCSNLTDGDEKGVEYLLNWAAFVVQNPGRRSNIGLGLFGEEGTGKNAFVKSLMLLLGTENCVEISNEDIESSFNDHYMTRLLVALNETTVTPATQKRVSAKLKRHVNSETLIVEIKNLPRYAVENRMNIVAMSNDELPITLARNDRRWTVFLNEKAPTETFKKKVGDLFDDQKAFQLTEAGLREVRAFGHHLMTRTVDRGMLASPYKNESRDVLIDTNLPPAERFVREVGEHTIDQFISEIGVGGVLLPQDLDLAHARLGWDCGPDGVKTEAIFAAFEAYCRTRGMRPCDITMLGRKLAVPVANKKVRLALPGTDYRPWGYTVKRSPEALAKYEQNAAKREQLDADFKKQRQKSKMPLIKGSRPETPASNAA